MRKTGILVLFFVCCALCQSCAAGKIVTQEQSATKRAMTTEAYTTTTRETIVKTNDDDFTLTMAPNGGKLRIVIINQANETIFDGNQAATVATSTVRCPAGSYTVSVTMKKYSGSYTLAW